jgi:hypothetical protein
MRVSVACPPFRRSWPGADAHLGAARRAAHAREATAQQAHASSWSFPTFARLTSYASIVGLQVFCHAGGGTRTPDTRIMIPLLFGSAAPFAGAEGHERGHICTVVAGRPGQSLRGRALVGFRKARAANALGRESPLLKCQDTASWRFCAARGAAYFGGLRFRRRRAMPPGHSSARDSRPKGGRRVPGRLTSADGRPTA